MKNRSAKRKTRLPQENGRRQTAARRRLTFICLQVEPGTRWNFYTRCSSCGLTIGSISDRRKVNFPKTFYTLFPRIVPVAKSQTTPHISESNGRGEAFKKLVTNVARKILLRSKLTKGFWPEAVSAAVFLLNRMPSERLKGRSPYPVVAEAFQWTPSLPYVMIMLATPEPMAALLLCMIILLPGETNLLQGQRRAP